MTDNFPLAFQTTRSAQRVAAYPMGRWTHATTQFGVLNLTINEKTGRPVGVSKSGGKRSARVWCPRRQKQMHLGNYPNTPQAAIAIASAQAQGVENLPTPKERKTRRDKKSGVRAAKHPPHLRGTDC